MPIPEVGDHMKLLSSQDESHGQGLFRGLDVVEISAVKECEHFNRGCSEAIEGCRLFQIAVPEKHVLYGSWICWHGTPSWEHIPKPRQERELEDLITVESKDDAVILQGKKYWKNKEICEIDDLDDVIL